ncbi:DUF4189 domain-containing protein [Solicola gregarius]|uniref:DUF4189 domain-containing protein n=1 Tax=Solicola gregarius TaxID=2908642 RepID=A0AA46YM86_9ACTN|nr:DUF4189 domain-containing protein [Solicola gregarius]UYM05548.1 DUF4189 domain-containing protein [Solicola gregarius]
MPSLGPMLRMLTTTAVAALLTVGLLSAGPAAARPAGTPTTTAASDGGPDRAGHAKCWRKHRRCFSAASIDTINGKSALAINKMTKKRAVRTAQRRCESKGSAAGCTKAGWVRNGWLAVAYRMVNGRARDWASGVRYGETAARKRARSRLVGPGRRKYWTWVGTDRSTRYRTGGQERFGQW